ncbi:MAG: hypothetical protein JNM61_06560 [Zoogloeaceae bacterium]|nr:hypothetical protein [Zoogloeaceae bacterium]
MNLRFRWVAPIVVAWLSGCAVAPPYGEPPGATLPANRDDSPSARGRLKPMPVRPLQVKTDCRFKDETGYSGSAILDVDYDQVRSFSATVNIPRRGQCRFDLAEFEQRPAHAHVALHARNGCTVRMWEQGNQVTVAFAQCGRQCTGNAADYLWPILVDRPSGRCD